MAQNTEESGFSGTHIQMRGFVIFNQLSLVHYVHIVIIQTVEIRWALNIKSFVETHNKYSNKFGLITELNGSMI